MERTRPVEVRLEGRTLHGIALRYNEPARDRPEMFLPGAFQPIGLVSLNLQHDPFREIASTDGGSLRITDTDTELRLEADLRQGSAELSLLRRRALRGLSVEFRSRSERRDPAGVRVIERAELPRIGLVDAGSYRTELELRRRADWWLDAEIPYDKAMRCTCQGGGRDSVRFDRDAFADLKTERPGLLAIGGEGFASVLGSLRRGTLQVEDTDTGLRVGLVGTRDTEAGRRVVEAARVGDVFARPMIDPDRSEYRDEGTERLFTRAFVTGLLVKATPNDVGHIPVRIAGLEVIEEVAEEIVEPRRRRRIWL